MDQNQTEIDQSKGNKLLWLANIVLENGEKDLLPPDYDQTGLLSVEDLQEDEASYRARLNHVKETDVDGTKPKPAELENSLPGVSRLSYSVQRVEDDVSTFKFQPVKIKPNIPNGSEQNGPDEAHVLSVSPCGVYFKFGTVIGRGAVKTVYRGLDSQKGIPIAWCEIVRSRWKKKDRQRFRDEAHLLSLSSHPNILRCCGFWEGASDADPSVLITEYMTFGTLKSYIRKFKRISLRIAKNWCVQILEGLRYLHTRSPPIIHRDLKCDNIFVQGPSGCIKIGDLGLATRAVNGCTTHSIVGTPGFMAAEMYNGYYDESVDIYAFGMCMIEILTSENPYSECISPCHVFKNVTSGVRPGAYFKVEDPAASFIIRSCIQLNRHNRPNCTELLNSAFFTGSPGKTKTVKIAKSVRKKLLFPSDTSGSGSESKSAATTTSGMTPLSLPTPSDVVAVEMGVFE